MRIASLLCLSLLSVSGFAELPKKEKCPYRQVSAQVATDLSGIRFFEVLDRSPRKVFEVGRRGEPGHIRAEYRPSTGEYLYDETGSVDSKGDARTMSWGYNERTGNLSATHGETDAQLRARFDRQKEFFASKLDLKIPSGALGYPEVSEILKRETAREPTDPKLLQKGDCLLFFSTEGLGELTLVEFDALQTDRTGQWMDFNPSEVTGAQRLTIHTGRSKQRPLQDARYVRSDFYEVQGHRRITPDLMIWKISKHDAETISKYRSVRDDPMAEFGMTREELTVYVTLQNLQYIRWGKDHVDYHSEGDAAHKKTWEAYYASSTPESYAAAIDALIGRVGEATFSKVVKQLFDAHLRKLHTSLHTDFSPFAPHSDISPFGGEYGTLAREAIHKAHPTAQNMTESGHVVNAKTLFADEVFWMAMKKRPALFNGFVDHLKAIPKDYLQTGSTYGVDARIDPIALVKQHFPETFRVIHEQRPDFDSDTKPAIQIVK